MQQQLSAYARVQNARAKGRQTALSFINSIFTNFVEMHGDRRFSDDKAIVTGIALLSGESAQDASPIPVTVIGIEKGSDTQERVSRNFGSVHPEGYRKALRQAKLAEKFHRPVICFVDTSGAYCGIGAEERGQGQAIAESMSEFMALKTPVISIVIGEGGSGGALALAVADEVWMLENAVYSVISPEGASSIIWKDGKHVKEACECLRLTADDLKGFGVIERIFQEGEYPELLDARLREALRLAIERYSALETDALLEHRYKKFRKIGGQPQ